MQANDVTRESKTLTPNTDQKNKSMSRITKEFINKSDTSINASKIIDYQRHTVEFSSITRNPQFASRQPLGHPTNLTEENPPSQTQPAHPVEPEGPTRSAIASRRLLLLYQSEFIKSNRRIHLGARSSSFPIYRKQLTPT